jgi:hypothetical protein
LASPKIAWTKVKYRDWLIATLLEEVAGHKQEFIAISEPLIASIDLLSKEFTRDMKGVTDAIRELLLSDSGKERSLFTTLSLAVSKRQHNGKDVFSVGAGMRRRARFWVNESETLQADVEFFVPFYVIPDAESTATQEYSICAGIALTRSNGSAIMEKEKDLVAVRFNLRLPFRTEQRQKIKSDEFELITIFGEPEIKIEKQIRESTDARATAWRKFDDWKDFVKDFCESTQGTELLNVPIGPLLLETMPITVA